MDQLSALAASARTSLAPLLDTLHTWSSSPPVPRAISVPSSYVTAFLTSPLFPLHLRNISLAAPSLAHAITAIVAAPLIWNVVAQLEFRTRALSRLVGARPGAYALAAWIFCFSIYRDVLFDEAMAAQPRVFELGAPGFVAFGALAMAWGSVLVVSSMWKLGVTGTYLGDYFGILMKEKVESFPFNYYEHPMYDGATMCFLGRAILYVGWNSAALVGLYGATLTFSYLLYFREESPAGILLSLWVFVVYSLATSFEEPFTSAIYSNASASEKKNE